MGYTAAGGMDYAGEFSHDEMNRSSNLAERVRFGTFELNVRTSEIVSIGTTAEAGSAKVLLREQPFQNLLYLLAGDNFALPLHQDSQNLEGLLAEQDL